MARLCLFTRFIGVGLLVCALASGASAATRRAGAANKPFDLSKSAVEAKTWDELSTLLTEYIKSKVASDPSFEADGRLYKFVKTAYLLGPENRPAVLLHVQLKKQTEIGQAEKPVDDQAALIALLKAAQQVKDGDNPDDEQIARYLYALGLLIDPQNEDCLYESQLLMTKHGPVDWQPLVDEYNQALSVADGYQQAVNGLVVMDINNVEVGQVAKILLTYRAKGGARNKLNVTFVQSVGRDMKLSLDEATRYVETYSAGLKLPAGMLEISFEDKYSSKDGGSAGSAYAVLIRSFTDQFKIDEKFAMTGDISVEGRVLKIGGVYAKVRGAHVDGCTRVAIPKENAEDLADDILLNGPQILGQIEIFSLETIEDAIALARQDKAVVYEQASGLWAQLKPLLADEQWKESQEAAQILTRVLELCPNHVSAKLLKDVQDGTIRTELSLTRSVLHLNDILVEYFITIRQGDNLTFKDIREETTVTNIEKAIDRLDTAEVLMDPQAREPHGKLLRTCQSIGSYIRANRRLATQEDIVERKRKAADRSRAVVDRLRATLNTASKSSVARYNGQVDRANKAADSYRSAREELHRRVEESNRQLEEVFKDYNEYMTSVQSLVQDPEVLEKLVRGR